MKKLLIGLLLITPMACAMQRVKERVKDSSLSQEATKELRRLMQKYKEVSDTHLLVTGGEELIALESSIARKVEKLIAEGADVNAACSTYDEKCSPLHLAVKEGFPEVCKILKGSGANLGAKDKRGYTPISLANSLYHASLDAERYGSGYRYAAPSNKYKEILAILNTNSNESNELLEEVGKREPDIKQVLGLIEQGVDVNARNARGSTCLHVAAGANKTPEMVENLVGLGAEVDARDERGFTPLHKAASSGREETCKVLIGCGAEVNAKNNSGFTPFFLAKKLKHCKACEVLYDNGADISLTDEEGRTLFCLAAENGLANFCAKLLEIVKTIDLSAKYESGRTLLHSAAWSGYASLCKLLIGKGADVNAEDNKGKTPLFYTKYPAVASIDDTVKAKVAEVLIDGGAMVNATDNKGKTPLYCMKRGYNCNDNYIKLTVKLLEEHGAQSINN